MRLPRLPPICLVFLLALSVAVTAPVEPSVRYGVLADCGSSSTKIKVYKWTQPENSNELPNLELLVTQTIEPGISSYVGDVAGLREHLSKLIAVAKTQVPQEQQAMTPIFALATAGLRVLQPVAARDFTTSISNQLLDSSLNPFSFKIENAQILSGEEEGMFAWISLNYLAGFFNQNSGVNQSYGILEMGGGSTQIAFIPDVPIFADEFHVFLAGKKYSLYVHSYLHFGATYMLTRLQELVVERANENGQFNNISNPCQLRDDVANVQINNKNVRLVGGGDADQCRTLLRELVAKAPEKQCFTQPCGIGQIYQPPVGNLPFYATQAFVHGSKTVKALRSDESLDMPLLEKNSKVYCSKTLAQAESEYNMNRKFATMNCFNALYVLELLKIYGFTPASRIIVTSKVGNQAIDWAVGAILYHQSNGYLR